jgi:hypothetical protein
MHYIYPAARADVDEVDASPEVSSIGCAMLAN